MKYRIIIITLALVLTVSVGLNVYLTKLNLGSHDHTYGELAKQHLFNSKLLSLLEQGESEDAKSKLKTEVEVKGSILAICLLENCSIRAIEIMGEHNALE